MIKRKILKIVFITLLLISFCLKPVLATDSNLDTLISDMKDVGSVANSSSSQVRLVLNTVIRLIQIAGSGIAILVVVILGIKYMLASPGDKADYKKTAIPIVIGCLLLFAASFIAGVIANIGIGFNN